MRHSRDRGGWRAHIALRRRVSPPCGPTRSRLRALRSRGPYDTRLHSVCPYINAMPTRAWIQGAVSSSRPSCPPLRRLYISPVVRSCIICRRSDPLLLLHITYRLIDSSLYSSHPSQPIRLPVFQALYLPRLLVCSTIGGSTSTPPTLVKVLTPNKHYVLPRFASYYVLTCFLPGFSVLMHSSR